MQQFDRIIFCIIISFIQKYEINSKLYKLYPVLKLSGGLVLLMKNKSRQVFIKSLAYIFLSPVFPKKPAYFTEKPA